MRDDGALVGVDHSLSFQTHLPLAKMSATRMESRGTGAEVQIPRRSLPLSLLQLQLTVDDLQPVSFEMSIVMSTTGANGSIAAQSLSASRRPLNWSRPLLRPLSLFLPIRYEVSASFLPKHPLRLRIRRPRRCGWDQLSLRSPCIRGQENLCFQPPVLPHRPVLFNTPFLLLESLC